MSKGSIVFIVVAALTVASYLFIAMKNDAVKQRKRSDDIMQQFKTIDNSFKKDTLTIEAKTEELLKDLKEKAHATGR